MSFAAFVSIVAFLAGFALGLALTRWADADTPPPKPAMPPAPSLKARYLEPARQLAMRAYLAGAQDGVGKTLGPIGNERFLEKGSRMIHVSGTAVADLAGIAFVDGMQGLRRALGRRSGLEPGHLDEAVAAALKEVNQ